MVIATEIVQGQGLDQRYNDALNKVVTEIVNDLVAFDEKAPSNKKNVIVAGTFELGVHPRIYYVGTLERKTKKTCVDFRLNSDNYDSVTKLLFKE